MPILHLYYMRQAFLRWRKASINIDLTSWLKKFCWFHQDSIILEEKSLVSCQTPSFLVAWTAWLSKWLQSTLCLYHVFIMVNNVVLYHSFCRLFSPLSVICYFINILARHFKFSVCWTFYIFKKSFQKLKDSLRCCIFYILENQILQGRELLKTEILSETVIWYLRYLTC